MDIITEEQVEATHTLELERGKNGYYSGSYTVGDICIKVQASSGWTAEDNKKTRLYVSGAADVDFTEAYAMQRANIESFGSSMYERGTFPEEDKLFRDLNRKAVTNQRVVLDGAVAASPDLAELIGDTKFHFSRIAGCSCGCSPAFIASSKITIAHDGRNLNVTSIFIIKKEV